MADNEVEYIEINLGDGEDGKPRSMKLPKEFTDASGNKYDGQSVINDLNGKIKSVAMSAAEKKYAPKLRELEALQHATKGMIPAEKAREIEAEIEEMRIKLLPEKDQEIARLNLRATTLDKEVGTWKQTAEQSTKQYQEYLKTTELMSNLPADVIEQARNEQVEILRKYAKVGKSGEKDTVMMENIFESGGEPIDLKTFMTKYYAQPEKAYALKSSLVSGAGTQQVRNLNGKETFSAAQWQAKIASASPQDRKELNRKFASGEIIIN